MKKPLGKSVRVVSKNRSKINLGDPMGLQLLQPNVVLGDNVLALTPERLQAYGLRGLVLDVDDTIVSIASPSASPELLHWLLEAKQVVSKLWLVSNNPRRTRIQPIAESLGLPYLIGAGKPSRRKLEQAVQAMDLPYAQVAMVGDRIFTDVLAGNRLGLFTVLVKPISASTKSFHLVRTVEFGLARLAGVSLVSNSI
jgi:uncharacterized protein